MKKSKLFYIANIRLPTEKAHGQATMKMCEAFADAGLGVELIIPRRLNSIEEDPFDYYGVKRNFSIKKLPCLDLVRFGRIGFFIQWLSFAKTAALYCVLTRAEWYYGRDELSLWFISFFRKNVVWEPHTAKDNLIVRNLLKRCRAVVPISEGLKEHFISLGVDSKDILIAHSGVDLKNFEIEKTKEEIRKELSLPLNKKIVAYVGKEQTMGRDKGVSELREVLGNLQKENPEVYPLFVTDVCPKLVPLYMKSADVLVMNYPNTEHYAKYMSPLKLFEYMASGAPIVAPDLPSIRGVLNKDNAVLVKPGDDEDLAIGIKKIFSNKSLSDKISKRAINDVQKYTWDKRASKITSFIKSY